MKARSAVGMVAGPALAAFLISTAHAADPPVPIQMGRSLQPGMVYDIHYLYEFKAVTTFSASLRNPETKTDVEKADLTGRIEGLALNEKREETFLLNIAHMRRADGRDMIKPGTVLRIQRRRDAVDFTSNDRFPIPDEAKKYLKVMFHRVYDDDHDVDADIGTKVPRRPGEAWPIKNTSLASDLLNLSLQVLPSDLKGTTAFKGIETVDGISAMRLCCDITAENVAYTKLPPGIVVSANDYKGQWLELIPTDVRFLPLEKEITGKWIATIEPIAYPATGKLTVDLHDKVQYRPVKPDKLAGSTAAPAK